MSGHTILELMITAIIFSLFLLGISTILDVGFKSWKMVDIKTEVQQESIVSMNILSKELRLSSRQSTIIGGEGEEYVVFESAIGEDGYFHYDQQVGDPEWQAYIIYYTYPRNPVDPKLALDKSLAINKFIKKALIRKKIKHPPNCNPVKLAYYELYFTDPKAPLLIGEELIGRKPTVLSDNIFSMSATPNGLNSDAIDIKITFVKSILEGRLAYEKSFDDDLVKERMEIKNTILLKNTSD